MGTDQFGRSEDGLLARDAASWVRQVERDARNRPGLATIERDDRLRVEINRVHHASHEGVYGAKKV